MKKRDESKQESEPAKETKVVDWRKVDYNEDRRLSHDELVDLLKILRENPNKMLFDSEVGANLMMLSHPDFRRRVLFIAEEFGL